MRTRLRSPPRVLGEYAKLGISIHVDKTGVMRALSQRFARNEIKKVYALIMTSGPKSSAALALRLFEHADLTVDSRRA